MTSSTRQSGSTRPRPIRSSSRGTSIALVTLIIVLTDVTYDGKSLRISFGLPGRRRLFGLAFPNGGRET